MRTQSTEHNTVASVARRWACLPLIAMSLIWGCADTALDTESEFSTQEQEVRTDDARAQRAEAQARRAERHARLAEEGREPRSENGHAHRPEVQREHEPVERLPVPALTDFERPLTDDTLVERSEVVAERYARPDRSRRDRAEQLRRAHDERTERARADRIGADAVAAGRADRVERLTHRYDDELAEVRSYYLELVDGDEEALLTNREFIEEAQWLQRELLTALSEEAEHVADER